MFSFPLRRHALVGGVDPPEVIVVDVPEDDRFDLISGEPGRIHAIELFLFECCKEAFHSGVVIAAASSTHALDSPKP